MSETITMNTSDASERGLNDALEMLQETHTYYFMSLFHHTLFLILVGATAKPRLLCPQF